MSLWLHSLRKFRQYSSASYLPGFGTGYQLDDTEDKWGIRASTYANRYPHLLRRSKPYEWCSTVLAFYNSRNISQRVVPILSRIYSIMRGRRYWKNGFFVN